MIVSYRKIFLTFAVSFYLFVYFGGRFLFNANSGKDANLISNLDVDELVIGSSYSVMAYLYSIIPSNLLDVVCISLALIFIFTVYSDARNKINLIILSILIMIPCILTIATFQKDLILVLFTTPVAFIIKSNIRTLFKIISISTIYVIYALVFRYYFFLIILIFISLYLFYITNFQFKLLFVSAFLMLISFIPNEFYFQIQSPRDFANAGRIGYEIAGNRTAFVNPLQPNSLYNFVYNYLYATIRLNFGFFFNTGFKDLFFMFYTMTYYLYVFKGLVSKNQSFVLASFLVLSHGLTYFIFEPDTGSYARHLSSTLPYLAIIITGIYSIIIQKNQNSKFQ